MILLLILLIIIIIILLNKKKEHYTNYNIYLYWENKGSNKRPKYLDLCLETIKKYNNNVIVVTPENIYKYIPEDKVNKRIWLVDKIPQRADYFRYHILHYNGGMWLDFDTICLKNLNYLFKYLDEYDMFIHSEQFFGCKPGLFSDMLNELNDKLNKNELLKFNWTELGITTFKKYLDKINYIDIDLNLIVPKINYSSISNPFIIFDTNIKPEDFIKDEQLILKLYNSLYNSKQIDELNNNQNILFNKIIKNILK